MRSDFGEWQSYFDGLMIIENSKMRSGDLSYTDVNTNKDYGYAHLLKGEFEFNIILQFYFGHFTTSPYSLYQ